MPRLTLLPLILLSLPLMLVPVARAESQGEGAASARTLPVRAGTEGDLAARGVRLEQCVRTWPTARCGGCDRVRPLRDPPWHATFGAWVWGLEGTIGTGSRRVAVDSSWTDTLDAIDKLEFAVNARVRRDLGPWSVTAQVDGADVADSASFREGGRVRVDASASIWLLQVDVGRRLARGRLGRGRLGPTGTLEAYGGARLAWVDADLETSPIGPKRSGSDFWVDPLAGLRGELAWGRHWRIRTEGDVGGFGVGSDLSWSVLGAAAYRFGRALTLSAGWRVLDEDRHDGDSVFDVRLSGPFVALTLSL